MSKVEESTKKQRINNFNINVFRIYGGCGVIRILPPSKWQVNLELENQNG